MSQIQAQIQAFTDEKQAVSRFSRSMGTRFRVWSPPGAPVRIEYAASLLREARLEGADGVLYGFGSEDTIRIAAARARSGAEDPRLAGMEQVGIYCARERGEVFLTEQDLTQFDETKARVVLVIAGNNAGFFMREPDGSIQSIKSREEIPCPGHAKRPARVDWRPLALATVAMLAAGGAWLWRPDDPRLGIRQEAGQLIVSWADDREAIEIRDGADRANVTAGPGLRTITYAPRTGDVQVTLRRRRKNTSARFVGPGPTEYETALLAREKLLGEIAQLETTAASLTGQLSHRAERAASLRHAFTKMKRAD